MKKKEKKITTIIDSPTIFRIWDSSLNIKMRVLFCNLPCNVAERLTT